MVVPGEGLAVSEWIPCSERMPDKCGTYEVTALREYKRPPATHRVVTQCFCAPAAEHPWGEGVRVLAWRPLPEPWEG